MATRSITYCDRCKNDVAHKAVGPLHRISVKTDGDVSWVRDLCNTCFRELQQVFMREFPRNIPPPVPKPEEPAEAPVAQSSYVFGPWGTP